MLAANIYIGRCLVLFFLILYTLHAPLSRIVLFVALCRMCQIVPRIAYLYEVWLFAFQGRDTSASSLFLRGARWDVAHDNTKRPHVFRVTLGSGSSIFLRPTIM